MLVALNGVFLSTGRVAGATAASTATERTSRRS